MGHRLHIPRDGAKVGALTVTDDRACWARILLDGVDVTQGYQNPLDGRTRQVIAAHDIEGWIAVLDRATGITAQVRGDVQITFEPSEAVREQMEGRIQ